MEWARISLILSIIIALIGTIIAFVLIVPDKRRNNLNGFFKFVHDLFNFKFLVIEKILQATYIFLTIFMIIFGFFNIFTFIDVYSYRGGTATQWLGHYGFIIMLLGPIAIRIVYELFMMFVLLVKNVTQINNKLGTTYAENKPKAAPTAPTNPMNEGNWYCTQCGHPNSNANMFCNSCGKSK